MGLFSVLSLTLRPSTISGSDNSARSKRFRPEIEMLESRCVPTSFTMNGNTYSTLRSAIAASQPGDTIYFTSRYEQTYTVSGGELNISNSNLTIYGKTAGSKLADQISGGNASRVFNVESGAGLYLKNVAVIDGFTKYNGGAIKNQGTLTLSGCIISGSTASGTAGNGFGYGGGIENYAGATLNAYHLTTIERNTAAASGGGISSGGTLKLSDCHISGNTATGNGGNGGGGILVGGNSSSLYIYGGTVIENNEAKGGNGGGIVIDPKAGSANGSSPFYIRNSIIQGNTATDIGSGGAKISAAGYGGGISIDPGTTVSLFHDGFFDNNATGSNGGAIYAASGTLTMMACTITGNTTTGANGGVYISGAHDWIHDDKNVFTNNSPAGSSLTAAQDDPEVKVYNADGSVQFDFQAFPTSFTGGVRVAMGDVTGDGVPDIVVGAGPGGGPQVNIYDGVTGQLIRGFDAFPSSFTGGVFVAVANINGTQDVIVSADAGGGPQVTIWNGRTGALVASFYAFNSSFTGGVRIAVGDVNGDGTNDLICAAGAGGGPQVVVFDGNTLQMIRSFYAFAASFRGGVYVSAGDFTGSGHIDIVAGAGAGGGPQVALFDGNTSALLKTFYGLSQSFTGGVRVAAVDLNGDGFDDLVIGAGPGGGPQLHNVDSQTLNDISSFFAFASTFSGGIFVAAPR